MVRRPAHRRSRPGRASMRGTISPPSRTRTHSPWGCRPPGVRPGVSGERVDTAPSASRQTPSGPRPSAMRFVRLPSVVTSKAGDAAKDLRRSGRVVGDRRPPSGNSMSPATPGRTAPSPVMTAISPRRGSLAYSTSKPMLLTYLFPRPSTGQPVNDQPQTGQCPAQPLRCGRRGTAQPRLSRSPVSETGNRSPCQRGDSTYASPLSNTCGSPPGCWCNIGTLSWRPFPPAARIPDHATHQNSRGSADRGCRAR